MNAVVPPKLIRKSVLAKPPESLTHGVPVSNLETEVVDQVLEPKLYVPRVDQDLIRSLFETGLQKDLANDESDNYELDRWLAPRLHAALRMPRRIASQRRFWAWVAMEFGVRYVHQRFAEGGVVTAWRFTGDLLRNAVSRLWWAAELLRNGPDYSLVDLGLRRVRTAQFALELKYSWFRPAAIGFVKIAEGDKLTDKEMSALSVRANAYLPLEPLEAVAFSRTSDARDAAWWEGATTKKDLLGSSCLSGPQDGLVDPESLEEVMKWYRNVVEEERAAIKVGRGIGT